MANSQTLRSFRHSCSRIVSRLRSSFFAGAPPGPGKAEPGFSNTVKQGTANRRLLGGFAGGCTDGTAHCSACNVRDV